MSDSVLFKDFTKSANDLLTKDFPSPKDKIDRKFEFTSKPDSRGVNFVASLARKQEEKGPVLVGTLNPKLKIDAQNIEASATFDTQNKIEAEVSLKERLFPGLKNTVKVAAGNERSLNTSLEYKHKLGTVTAAADLYNQKDAPKIAASALVGTKGLYVGGAAEYQLAQPAADWTLLHAAAGYRGSSYLATVFAKWTKDLGKKKETRGVGATLFYDLKEHGVSVATQLDYDLQKATDNIGLTLGVSKKLNDGTTVLKAKYDTQGKVGLSYAQQVSANTKVAVFGEVNTLDLSPAGDHKWGFTLAFNE